MILKRVEALMVMEKSNEILNKGAKRLIFC